MGRIERTPAYIVGAKSWESDKAQVWFHKDSFLPLRFKLPDPSLGGGTLFDTYLTGYNSDVSGQWFPREMVVFDGKEGIESAAIAVCRPLPFVHRPAPKARGLVLSALSQWREAG